MTFSRYCVHTEHLFTHMEILIINRLVILRIPTLLYNLITGLLAKVLRAFLKRKTMKFIITTLEMDLV